MVNARQEGRRYISMRIAHMSNPQKEESALAKFRVVVLLFNCEGGLKVEYFSE